MPDGRSAAALEPATVGDAPVLAELLERYIRDLSGIFSVKAGPDGRYGYDKLPLYWSRPETHFPYLIKQNAEVAGFALATRGSPASDDPDDFDVAEFFVLPSHRRFGLGRQAAFLLWNRHPGRWVVRVSEMNRDALPFWESAVREYTGGAFTEKEHPGKTHRFRVFLFAAAVVAAGSTDSIRVGS